MARKKKETKETPKVNKNKLTLFDGAKKVDMKKESYSVKKGDFIIPSVEQKLEPIDSELTAEKLKGLTIKVNFKKSLMFIDRINNIYIGANKESEKNEYLVKEIFSDISAIQRALKVGTILLFKGDKNVTEELGGIASTDAQKELRVPIFSSTSSKIKIDAEKDGPLLKVLSEPDSKTVVLAVMNMKDKGVLERIRELELGGQNNFRSARIEILDAIKIRIKELTD
jgi:hypothetical protein